MNSFDCSFDHPVFGPDQTLAARVDGVGGEGSMKSQNLFHVFPVFVIT
jgi:hypothetical protein